MLTRTMKIQLALFALVSAMIVGYTAVKYAGFSDLAGSHACRISVDLADSGGIFSGAEVDYRGVAIGKVGALTPHDDGVRVDLELRSCATPRIPQDVHASVADLTVIGEQYIELRSETAGGPYLQSGAVIPQASTTLPIRTQVLLANLDGLTRSIDPTKLSTVITELGVAFDGQTANLRALLDSGATILDQAQANLPATIDLIKSSNQALSTQLDVSPAFASWARSLHLLTAELRADDPAVRSLLATAPSAIDTVVSFARDVQGPLGALFGNLITGGDLVEAHLNGVEQLLVMYPQLVADGSRIVTADGRLRLGVVVDWGEASPCVAGYGSTVRTLPETTTAGAPNLQAYCATGPVRGASRAPSGSTVAPASADQAPLRIDMTSAQSARLLGDRSWLTLLTQPLAEAGARS